MDTAQKSMEIQHQVRNNANELNDFLKGMKSWQEEMQAKDKQLLEAARIKKEKELEKSPSARKLVSPPPIRASKKLGDNSRVKKKSKDDTISSGESNQKDEKIKAYDYSAWDKFDVDKACEKVDDITSRKDTSSNKFPEPEDEESGETSDEKDEENTETNAKEEAERTERLISKQQAVAEKERGNEYFKVSRDLIQLKANRKLFRKCRAIT